MSDFFGSPQDIHKTIDKKEVKDQLQFTTSMSRITYLIAGVGIILMLAGITVTFFKNSNSEDWQENPTASNVSTKVVNDGEPVKMIAVDIEGAVEKAGVVKVPYNSRIQDVLITAGGMSPKADRKYLSKNLNLAQVVVDGMKIYIPFLGETEVGVNNAGQSLALGTSSNPLVSINNASAEDLDSLPGIGPVTAEKIISNRPYQKTSDLTDKKVLSKSVFGKIKSKISL